MSIATMEEETIDVNVKLNQSVREQFSRALSGIALNFQMSGYSYFKTGQTFVCLTWMVTGISEENKRLCS